ncbi:hypothetical protein MJO28_002302 [Puccinia striiformis f. sp. tritici]|uniref:Uncharacterized protein n=1 Tax=Puccinia striiformis f. sp. tritici TaxID=168172 RepID=A0ACC0EVZ0_9BASI|nr:hypothetical protein MJO28_002302 [Puccinia striiformis f. sp. tritici]
MENLFQFVKYWSKHHGYGISEGNSHAGKNVYIRCDRGGTFSGKLENLAKRNSSTLSTISHCSSFSSSSCLLYLELSLSLRVSKDATKNLKLQLLKMSCNPGSTIYPDINQNTRSKTVDNSMERINSTILKTALEAIPLLTVDNYSLWKNCIGNMLDLQGLCDSLTAEDGSLTNMKDVVIKAQDIWTSITSYFASTQPSNRARVFTELFDLAFNPNDVPAFINSVRTINSRLFEIGIDLPKDMIAYLLLKKLPPSLSNISQQITHSDKAITNDLVLDHLRLFNNDQLIISN